MGRGSVSPIDSSQANMGLLSVFFLLPLIRCREVCQEFWEFQMLEVVITDDLTGVADDMRTCILH